MQKYICNKKAIVIMGLIMGRKLTMIKHRCTAWDNLIVLNTLSIYKFQLRKLFIEKCCCRYTF